jgi:Ala-tRNA(Pro) deacylase
MDSEPAARAGPLQRSTAGDAGKEALMPLSKLRQALEAGHVPYESIPHDPAYTAQGIAAVAHVPGKELAKTVIMKLDGRLAMCVLPATRRISFGRVKKATGAAAVELATESEFGSVFPGCEVGAMPPFGNLYDLEVYVDDALTKDDEIAFNAGSHTELVRMSYADYEKLVHPTVCRLCN